MGEREPRGKVITIKESPVRRHTRHFVWPVRAVQTSNNVDHVIAEEPARQAVSPDMKIIHNEIPPKEDIFISSRMK